MTDLPIELDPTAWACKAMPPALAGHPRLWALRPVGPQFAPANPAADEDAIMATIAQRRRSGDLNVRRTLGIMVSAGTLTRAQAGEMLAICEPGECEA